MDRVIEYEKPTLDEALFWLSKRSGDYGEVILDAIKNKLSMTTTDIERMKESNCHMMLEINELKEKLNKAGLQ